ncbi:MAG: thiazole synthase [Deltaproteobacteria bacterium]|nr:thiazole synthase [Deltaproteobacteria bacterium]
MVLGPYSFGSRLLAGTGKFKDNAETLEALTASGAEVVTVAVRRVNLKAGTDGNLFDLLSGRFQLLPNTAGCFTADDAVRTCHLARELLGEKHGRMVKLEVIGDAKTLFPDGAATVEAAAKLVKDGFIVLPYITDDPVLALRCQDAGCAAVMPLAAPIGSGLGMRNPYNIRIILEQARVPVIVDAGVGTASDAALVMELGCHGVLMNTAIALAKEPVWMAEAMRDAVRAGRMAFKAGRIPRKLHASASSPLDGLVGT